VSAQNWLTQPLSWTATGGGEFPFETTSDGKRLVVRVNGFPEDETIYSLLVDGAEVAHFNDWPASWTTPEKKA